MVGNIVVFLETLFLLILLALFALTLLWSVEVIIGTLPRAPRPNNAKTGRPEKPKIQLTIIVPAHNEELVILETLESIKADISVGDRILVIADNCTDQTAALAAAAGFDVQVRTNEEFRGKGYALSFGIDHIRKSTPPDAVVIIDADCKVMPGSLDHLRNALEEAQLPAQALYFITAPDDTEPGLNLKVSEFAIRVKNDCRARGLHRLGSPVHLSGSGMAFLWSHINGRNLATGHLAEDLEFGLAFAADGLGVKLCEDALITSPFPTRLEAANTQKRRWIHGHIKIITGTIPSILVGSIKNMRASVLLLAIDAIIPPFFLLYALNLLAVFTVAMVYVFSSESSLLLLLAAAVFSLMNAALVFAWFRRGRDLIGWNEVAMLPILLKRTIVEVIKGMLKGEQNWIRTKRD